MFRLAVIAIIGLLAAQARAQEFPEPPDAPSAFSTVIDARDYDETFESVADVLDQVAGVRVRRFGGLGSFSTASIRGSKSEQVLVLLDGVRLNSAQRGAVDLSTLALRGVDRIEVIRGGGAARYGSDAVGGVISITSRARRDGDSVDASLLTGSLETLGADLFVSRGDGEGQTTLGYSRLRSDNDFRFDLVPVNIFPFPIPIQTTRHTRLNADFAQDTLLLNGSRALSPGAGLSGTLNLFQKQGGQPGTTLGTPLGSPDHVVNCTSSDEQFRRGVGGLVWRDQAFGEGALELSLSHRYERSELDDPGFCFTPERLGLDPDLRFTENASSAELSWASRARRIGPAFVVTRASFSGRFDQVRATRSDSKHRTWGSAFLQHDVRLFGGTLRLIPALGLEVADTSSGLTRVQSFNRPVDVDVEEDAVWLPRIGAILRLAPGLRLKANYLRAYRRPNFRELFHPDYGYVRGNPELEAEDGWNFDVGVELARRSLGPVSELRLEAAWFHRSIDESIEWLQVANTFLPVNTGEARSRGWELIGSLDLLRRLQLSASYTFLDTEIRSTGVPLPHSPRNELFLRASLPAGPARFWAEWRYEDAQKLVASPVSPEIDEERQLDAGIVLRPARVPGLRWVPHGITLSTEWVNLTGEQRVDSLGLPLPDDTLFFMTLRGEFQ